MFSANDDTQCHQGTDPPEATLSIVHPAAPGADVICTIFCTPAGRKCTNIHGRMALNTYLGVA